MSVRISLLIILTVPLIAGCTPTTLTNGVGNLFGGDECTTRVRQEAFDAGLNPQQAQARIRAQCG